MKFKNNIDYLKEDTSKIYDLTARTFFINSDQQSGIQIGYVAEEVAEVYEKFATYDCSKNPLSIDFNVITVFLVEENKKMKIMMNDFIGRM